ncbi:MULTISPECIES: AMP-binding protein [Rhodococcus]|uniref:AMP-binding protein n=1 Tax=Rhodococcus globerulus TaxID=33008 RepID=UPI001C586320|nr:AMP-binding protein [Rhodococcus globerulus]QXV99923.1 AMP-binding protein [Rhodococcus globerulus]
MTRVYEDLKPTFVDPHDWALPTVLRSRAASAPDDLFLIAPEESGQWTYAEVLDEAEAVAGSLHGAGAAAGDRLLIMAVNSSRFIRTWFGSAVASLVEVPINTAYEGEFLRHQLDTVGPRWAVIDDAFADRFVAIAASSGQIERFWVIDTGTGAMDSALETLRSQGWTADPWDTLLDGARVELPAPCAQDPASILFTSGTTGPSKGVSMPHAQMYFFAEEVVALTRLTAADTYLTMTPLFHGNAQFMAAYPALIAGARLVVRSKFSASRWVDFVRENEVTVTNFLGVMMDFAWKQPPRSDDADNTLRCIFAAPTASIVDEFAARFGVEAFVEVFGLTETCAPILSPYGVKRPAGAAGLAAAEWFDVRLVDPATDEEVPVGEVGELVVRPRLPWTCSQGYYAMPDKTVEAWRNLWFHTGDALRRDEDGWYYFVDRYKDALRRRGENISSYEVEQAVLSIDEVVECAVIGVTADVDGGEDEVLAVIVAREPIAAEDIWNRCEGRIPAFAVPRYIRFVDALPKTPSEKVRKAVLREEGITEDTADRTLVPAH